MFGKSWMCMVCWWHTFVFWWKLVFQFPIRFHPSQYKISQPLSSQFDGLSGRRWSALRKECLLFVPPSARFWCLHPIHVPVRNCCKYRQFLYGPRRLPTTPRLNYLQYINVSAKLQQNVYAHWKWHSKDKKLFKGMIYLEFSFLTFMIRMFWQ